MKRTKEGMTIKAMRKQLCDMRRIHRAQENTLMAAINHKYSREFVTRLKRSVAENGL